MYRSINYWTHFCCFYSKQLYLSKNQIEIDFPHHAIIEHQAMCQTSDGIGKPAQWHPIPLENRVYDVTVLTLLSHLHSAQCSIIAWWGWSAFMSFCDKYNNGLNNAYEHVFNDCIVNLNHLNFIGNIFRTH